MTFSCKLDKLRNEITALNSEPSFLCIEDLIMTEKDCCFEFGQICMKEQLFSINNDKPTGIDNLEPKPKGVCVHRCVRKLKQFLYLNILKHTLQALTANQSVCSSS